MWGMIQFTVAESFYRDRPYIAKVSFKPTDFTLTTGDAGNASFTIEGNQLKAAAELNYEAKNEYTIGQGYGFRWAQYRKDFHAECH